ncbi:MAG TPA: DUF4330 domain-containing protein [Candidatus Monoglobus merdigallinarum]|uniref:DUF4330 domain-containing protein n=1 Tax=Candidatus Monoglobus merdigallinarum TaxID=2838698 RepID=A0A9D1TLS3_9FIRM|nr:DUF4330 domain-containing protein [Candidatus Monoglobus merdigallinarum]
MKAKFNVMDFVIIVAVVLVIAAAAYFFVSTTGASVGGSSAASQSVKATIEIEFADKEEYLTQLPKAGDSVTIGVRDKMPATVVDVRVEPAEKMSYDLVDGSASWQEIPERYDIYVVMEADAVDAGDTIRINDSAIRVGDANAVRAMGWAGYGYVTRLDVSE